MKQLYTKMVTEIGQAKQLMNLTGFGSGLSPGPKSIKFIKFVKIIKFWAWP